MGGNRTVAARTDVISQGDAPQNVHLVMAGVACRYKVLSDGRRAIMALLLPGDFCDLHVAILDRMDHNIGALTECSVVEIPRDILEDMLLHHPRIARAMWWATLVDEAILREWLVSMGRRRADRQLAHLYCELYVRLNAVGGLDGDLPSLTLEQLADTLGITTVHAHRVQQVLRDKEFVSVQGRSVRIEDFDALAKYGDFDPDYLHLS